MKTLNLIKSRRSIRKFKKAGISSKTVKKILEAGQWAPSGLNNQPWRFLVLEEQKKDALAKFTHYSYVIKGADKIILVFLDKKSSYNLEKDLMAIGACIQNMLLYIHSKNLGACWLGEILNRRAEVKKALNLSKSLKLEAVLAIGYSAEPAKKGKRENLKNLVLKNF
ncbi:MAG: nitroreductase [Candidatus Omnitrophota bacterium]|jgi:nitroreductase